MTEEETIHASCVAVDGRGVLLLGPPGAGKSDLVLRLIDQPGHGLGAEAKRAALVADDQVTIRRDGRRLVASPPAALAGKFEIRGLGIVEVPHCPTVTLALAVRLDSAAAIDRLPGPERFSFLGETLPLVRIDPLSASAPARLRAALDWLCRR